MEWQFCDVNRYHDFKGFLFGKGYKILANNQFQLINVDSIEEQGLHVSCNMFKASFNENVDYEVHVVFTGQVEVGKDLVNEYIKSLPSYCKDDIKEMSWNRVAEEVNNE